MKLLHLHLDHVSPAGVKLERVVAPMGALSVGVQDLLDDLVDPPEPQRRSERASHGQELHDQLIEALTLLTNDLDQLLTLVSEALIGAIP